MLQIKSTLLIIERSYSLATKFFYHYYRYNLKT